MRKEKMDKIIDGIIDEDDALLFMSSKEFAPIDRINYMKQRMEDLINFLEKEAEKLKVNLK